jgi:integrase
LAYVRDQLGHSSIQITVDTYSHWIPTSNRTAVDRLDARTTPDKTGDAHNQGATSEENPERASGGK